MKRWSHSLFVRFSTAFLFVGLIPLIALSIFSLRTFTSHVERNTLNNLEQMVYYMGYNLNNIFADYNEISKMMYLNTTDGSNLGTNQSLTINVNENERINQMSIEDFLTTVLYSDAFIRNVFFVRSVDGKIYRQSRDNKAFIPEKLPLDDWLVPIRSDPQKLAVIPTHAEPYYSGSNMRAMTVGRNLIDTSGVLLKTPKVVGTLFFDIDTGVFDELFRELNLGDQDELYVVDGQGYVYYSNRNDIGGKVALDNGSEDDQLTLSQDIPFLKGEVFVHISKSALYGNLTSTRTAVLIAILICSVVLVGMGVWFSKRLSNPIRDVIKEMVKVESGNLDVQSLKGGMDEVGRLSHGFNRMVERLRSFIDEAYVAEIKQKQTELNALKSQIRPHYLYNTLEVIRMNAVANDDNEVGDMILSLSKQLKYVIDYGEDWVTIRREIEHLNDYFNIIEVRYENRIELRYEIAGEVDPNWSILKLSLQPIVENAIQHGILPKGGKGSIRLTIETLDGHLVVTVYDDGIGMNADSLEKLMFRLNETAIASKNVGLKNVHDRIKTSCGPEYGLTISSREEVGTSVRMVLPIRQGGTEHGDSNVAGG